MKALQLEGGGLVPGELRLTPVEDLEPHPDNPRRGDEELLRESIEANGFFQLVVAQASTGRIIAGNPRWREAKRQGAEALPVYHADLDDAAALRLLLADNRASDLGRVDYVEVVQALRSLVQEDETLEGTGYTESDLEALVEGFRRPGMDELLDEYGEPGDRDFWPVLRLEVAPEDAERFWRAMAAQGGDDTAGQFDALVHRLEEVRS